MGRPCTTPEGCSRLAQSLESVDPSLREVVATRKITACGEEAAKLTLEALALDDCVARASDISFRIELDALTSDAEARSQHA